MAQISACWSLACVDDNHNKDNKVVLSSSTLTSTTASSSSSFSESTPSVPMVKRRSKTSRCYNERPINQLFKTVSPYDELKKTSDEMFPFDEFLPKHQARQDDDERQAKRDKRDEEPRIPSEIVVTNEIPAIISFPTNPTDDDSELSWEDVFRQEERSLTPHPSFDEGSPTAHDFHYLFNASRKLEEEDWPSDEDGPLENPGGICFWSQGSVHKRNLGKASEDGMMIMRNVDHDVSKRPSNEPKYRLV